MAQSAQPLNPWLVSYIEQHRSKQNRYEIDKFLIESGCDPAEIELVWESFEPPPPEERKLLPLKTIIIRFCVVIGLLFVLQIFGLFYPAIAPFFSSAWYVLVGIMFYVGIKQKIYSFIWGSPLVLINMLMGLISSSGIKTVAQVIVQLMMMAVIFIAGPIDRDSKR